MMQVNDQPRDDSPPGGSVASAGVAGSCCASSLQKLLSPQLFKALADPRRLALLMRLADGGRPFTVGQLAEGSGVDLSVVSRHLAVLREAGVIKCVKQGKEVWCTVQTRAVAQILRDLAAALEACCAEAVCTPAGTETPELAAAWRAERQPA